MLGEYAADGAVLRRYNRSVSKLDGPAAEAVVRFEAWLRAADRSVSTVRTYGSQPARIVAAVDRDNPSGKRDYAIILLITRPGLRGVDGGAAGVGRFRPGE